MHDQEAYRLPSGRGRPSPPKNNKMKRRAAGLSSAYFVDCTTSSMRGWKSDSTLKRSCQTSVGGCDAMIKLRHIISNGGFTPVLINIFAFAHLKKMLYMTKSILCNGKRGEKNKKKTGINKLVPCKPHSHYPILSVWVTDKWKFDSRHKGNTSATRGRSIVLPGHYPNKTVEQME